MKTQKFIKLSKRYVREENFSTELAEKLDDYLGYVIENWMEENELAVESGIRSDIAENFIGGLKELFDANFIDVPDEKYDIVEDITQENEELKVALNESIQNILGSLGDIF